MNPYRNLPDDRFWPKAVAYPQPGAIDPVSRSRAIGRGEKVATMGSCFAQHIARHIQASGLDYFVPERAPLAMSREDAVAHNYGTFSARYGNVYTVRQAIQLFDRASSAFVWEDDVWTAQGGYVDAFRPRIDPIPKESPDEVLADRVAHLESVRRVFGEADWIVFTLGLTEAWRSRVTGAVYPLAPGVAGGAFDPHEHEFVNFTVAEVRDDLAGLLDRLRTVNPRAKVILTVSPVPLMATYEPRHVLQSTVVSKAILRVAADEIERRYGNVIYFPSYEIITSPAAAGRYYADDLREVTPVGVAHVMRVFNRHFVRRSAPTREDTPVAASRLPAPPSIADLSEVVCDEEVIAKSLQDAGLR